MSIKGENSFIEKYSRKKIAIAYSSITRSISTGDITGSVLFNFGWKHITLQVPLASAIWKSGSSLGGGDGVFSNNAGKSFGKTYVDSYFGFTCQTLIFAFSSFLFINGDMKLSNLSIWSGISRTQRICWIEIGNFFNLCGFWLATPWSLQTMWTHQNPLPIQWIKAVVLMFYK